MTLEQYKAEIEALDYRIEIEKDNAKKIELIDRNIKLNNEYIALLKKPITLMIILCAVLSILYLIGLAIFLPLIIIRKNKIRICQERIAKLRLIKQSIKEEKE